jgi:hypothetical protein
LYAVGLSFCLDWHPWRALLAFSPWSLIVLTMVVGLYAVIDRGAGDGPIYKTALRILDAPARRWVLFCGASTALGALLLAYGPLEAVPHVPDDIAYLWQARTFAQGKLYMPSHDLPEFFHLLFMVNDGRWYSLFQPGWPALLSLAVFPGLEFALNPILGGLATMLVYPIGRRVFSERVSKLGMLLITVSPMHLAISATLLAHTLALVLTELAILATLRIIEKNRLADALILGGSLGFLFTTRALNSIATLAVVSIPLIVYLVRGRVSIWKLAAGVPLAMVFLGLQLGYNKALTGEALYWPQDRYFDISEPKKGCHSLGFGTSVGCPVVHPERYFPDGFTPLDAVGVFHERMGTFLVTLFGFQMIFLFLGASFFSDRGGWRKLFLLSTFLSLLIAYFFWYFHGLWGRYYYESAFAIFLLIAAGMTTTHQGLTRFGERRGGFARRATAVAIPGIVLSYLVFNVFIFLPYAGYEILANSFFSVDSRLARVEKDIPHKSVIFLQDWYQMGFIIMRPGLPNERLFVQDLGKKHNLLMMQYYPDWSYFTYTAADDNLTPIRRKVRPSPVFVELEWKILNGLNSGQWTHYENFTAANGDKASNQRALVYDAANPGDWTGFDQMIFADGLYRVQLTVTTGPDRGKMALSINGQDCGEPVDTYSPEPGLIVWQPEGCGDIALSRGLNRFVLKATGKNPASSGYRIGGDLMTLEKRRNGGSDH